MKFLKAIKPVRTIIALLALFCLVSACANVDITKTASGYHAPTDPNNVDILKTRPDRHYEELGTLTVTGFDSGDTAKMHNAIRAKAAELGANAVILTEQGLVPRGWGNYDQWATGVAIYYTSSAHSK